METRDHPVRAVAGDDMNSPSRSRLPDCPDQSSTPSRAPFGDPGDTERPARRIWAIAASIAPYIEPNQYRFSLSTKRLGRFPVALHYVRLGEARGIWPTGYFDVAWYRAEYSEEIAGAANLFHHFVTVGQKAGLLPNAAGWFPPNYPFAMPSDDPSERARGMVPANLLKLFFDSEWYYRQTPELHAFEGDPIDHYFRFGSKQGRWPHPEFDTNWYRNRYPAVRASNLDPLVHYVVSGRTSGCLPNPRGQIPPEWRRLDREDSTGLFHRGFSLSRLRQLASDGSNLPPPADHEASALDQLPATVDASVVSLDVWDTLIRRDCHPDEIKLRSARHLLMTHAARLRPDYSTPVTLYRARLDCEAAAAPNGDFEFRLADALRLWLEKVLRDGSFEPGQLDTMVGDLLEAEVGFELGSVRPDRSMLRWLERVAETPKVVVSDFYMSAPDLGRIIAAAGIPCESIRSVYVSSESLDNKRGGRLFDRVLGDLEAAADQVIHVGDNPLADLESPLARGLKAHLYVNSVEERRRAWFGAAMERLLAGDCETHLSRIGALVEMRAREEKDELSALGMRIAPLAVGLVLAAMETAIREGASTVWFCTREGVFLKELYDRLATARPYGVTPPESRLLHVSRRSTFAASMERFSRSGMERLWSLYSTQSPKAMARSLKLEEDFVRARCAAVGVDWDKGYELPGTNPEFGRLIDDPDFIAHANDKIAEARAALLGYLGELGLTSSSNEPVAFVDIGWRGTIQDNLARLIGRDIVGVYLGLFQFINEQPSNARKRGYVFDENGRIGSLAHQEVAPLELAFNCAGGTVAGYTREKGHFRPEMQVHEPEERCVSAVSRPIQMGVLAVADEVMSYMERHGLVADDLQPLALALANALVTNPPAVLADGFFELEHNETFGAGDIEAMRQQSYPGDKCEQCDPWLVHGDGLRLLERVRWRDGFVRTSEITRFVESRHPAARHMPLEFTKTALLPADPHRMKIGFVCPPPIRGSGGHRTVFSLVRRLLELGIECEIMLQDIGDGADVIQETLGRSTCVIHQKWVSLEGWDAVFATTPRSAQFISRNLGSVPYRFYFIQDMEGLFSPMGDDFIRAENSYGFGFTPIIVGRWMSHLLANQFGVLGYPSGLGQDGSVYFPRPDVTREKAVAVLYQPEKPRRAPELTLRALKILLRRQPDTTVYLFGSEQKPPRKLSEGFVQLGLVTELPELSRLYSRCRTGVSLSFSNPSRIPFEMMACGAVPVDVYRYNNLFDFPDGTALLAGQTAESLASALELLLVDDGLFQERQRRCLSFVADRSLAWEMDAAVNAVLACMSGKPFPVEVASPVYSEAPVLSRQDEEHGRHQAEWNRSLAARRLHLRGGDGWSVVHG